MVCRVEPQHRCASGEAWGMELLLDHRLRPPAGFAVYCDCGQKGPNLQSARPTWAGSPGLRTITVHFFQDRKKTGRSSLALLLTCLCECLTWLSLCLCVLCQTFSRDCFDDEPCLVMPARHTHTHTHTQFERGKLRSRDQPLYSRVI